MPRDNEHTAQTGAVFASVIATTAMPYGYTVSLWCSGALLIHSRGNPTVAEIVLFAAGAVTAFAVLAHPARRRFTVSSEIRQRLDPALTGALHWFAVGIAIAAVTAIAHVGSWIAWPVGSFAATALYLVGATLEATFTATGSETDRADVPNASSASTRPVE